MYTAAIGLVALLLGQVPAATGTSGHLLWLLKQRIVQEEIDLEPNALSQLATFDDLVAQGRKELGSTLGLTPNEEVAWLDRMAELKSAADREACKLLTEKQQKRLAQIYAQQVGRREHRFDACLLSDLAIGELGLSDSQRAAITARSQKFQNEFWRSLDEFDAEFERIASLHRQKCLDILSERQRADYGQLVGEPFAFGDSDATVLSEVLKTTVEKNVSSKEEPK